MIGKVIGHYRVERKIGSGSMGEVYLAQDSKLKRPVALKFLPLQTRDRAEQLARFLREAQAAAALNHPSICTVHEINETSSGQAYIVMDFYPGRNLKDHLKDGPLPEKFVLNIAPKLADGLASAHQAGIIHRDIKPANLMLNPHDEVRILDFGLAKMVKKTSITDSMTTFGTAGYMSPEQAGGKPVDHRTDIWSLGVVMYEMLTGSLPFPGEISDAVIYGILHNEPAPMPESCCSPELQLVIHRMLAKIPADRYQEMAEVMTDLARVAGHTPVEPAPGKKSRWRRGLFSVLTILALSAGYLGLETALPIQ